jgi:hypothetical protein
MTTETTMPPVTTAEAKDGWDLWAYEENTPDGDDAEGMALIVEPLRAKYNLSNVEVSDRAGDGARS